MGGYRLEQHPDVSAAEFKLRQKIVVETLVRGGVPSRKREARVLQPRLGSRQTVSAVLVQSNVFIVIPALSVDVGRRWRPKAKRTPSERAVRGAKSGTLQQTP